MFPEFLAKNILANSLKLKDLFNSEDGNIYIKPDKTKSERERERDDFTRLVKRKNELLTRHPTADEKAQRVVVKNGSLLVDGSLIDSYRTPQTLF